MNSKVSPWFRWGVVFAVFLAAGLAIARSRILEGEPFDYSEFRHRKAVILFALALIVLWGITLRNEN